MARLANGTQLRTQSGKTLVVSGYIAEGGQGEVYRVELEGQPYALKWYWKHAASQELGKALVDSLIPRGSPSPKFVWPIEFVEDPQKVVFGYTMDLIERGRFHDLSELIGGLIRPEPTLRTLCTIAIEVASCYKILHQGGWCYQDISWSNIQFGKQGKDVSVLIFDNDNARVDKQTSGDIDGTYPFKAPEIWRKEAKPSIDTDRHSVAVLLFYMFIRNHPLEGKRELVNLFDEIQTKLYGTDPIFIFDPNNSANRPVPGYHDRAIRNWDLYPNFIKDLFITAFGEGLRDPRKRITEGQWISAFSRLRDNVLICQVCGAENFLSEVPSGQGMRPPSCGACKAIIPRPPCLKIKEKVIFLHHDTKLFLHHLGYEWDFETPVAEVTRHPQKPNLWGLRNLSQTTWNCTLEDGTRRDVQPGLPAPLSNNLVISFGSVDGVLRI